ncbi:Signal transduction histidine kinase [Halorhabdus sp. SVX81]|uniref:response regulator n=1 Tax=Halorhabdus sp. SVX81 TaxID=2978283 RepID=UPI0023DCDEC4|nr:response regulator [Halorhabdus sp. SVX81]WEL17435.1 Signal transduction histidine kinase [Halorhabdus sp. SVX81]
MDDEPDVLALTATFLERENPDFVVETATSADAGRERLADGTFDCVVSDYEMPGANGIEFLETVREGRPDLPFILFTGRGSEEIASDAISAGVTDYLQKSGGSEQYTVLANRIENAVEQARSRRLLERSQRRLREVIDALPHLLYIVDETETYLLANQALADFHGTTVEAIEGARVPEIIGEPAAEQFRTHLTDVLNSSDPIYVPEVELTVSEGETHVFESRLFSHELAGTDTQAALGLAVDISDHIDRERQLQETNVLLSTLFDTLPVGVLAETESGTVLSVNQRLLDLFAVTGSPSDIVGTDSQQLKREIRGKLADPDRLPDRTDDPTMTPAPEAARQFDLADGSTFERSYRPVDLPDGMGHLWVYRDVTEHTERKAELGTIVDRLENLHDATRDLIRAEDRETVARLVADSVRSILDHPSNVVRLRDGAVLRPVAVTTGAKADLGDRPSYAIGEGFPGEVYETGEHRLVEDFEACERDVDNGPHRSALYLPIGDHGTLSIGDDSPETFDTLDRTLATVLANNAATVLDRLAGERTLRRQNKRLAEFGRVVGHDLRNPLEVARTRCRLAREDHDFDHLEAVERAHERMEALIDDLFVLARNGEMPSDQDWLEFGALANDCWATVSTGAATFVNEADDRIRADEGRLRELLENLFRNAVEHSSTSPDSQARQNAVEHRSTSPRSQAPEDAVEHGGETVQVRLETTADGFVVADDGPGIPAGDRDRVFEVGYSTTEDGTGFGLSIVSQVADSHGWDVTVSESTHGGARFEFTGVEIEQ